MSRSTVSFERPFQRAPRRGPGRRRGLLNRGLWVTAIHTSRWALVILTALLAALLPAAGVAQAQVTGINPVLPVSPGTPTADPSHGFLVLNQNNASLFTNETEGPVAVGGNLAFQNYRTGLNNSGGYVLPGDSLPTSTVVGGALDFPSSGSGSSVTVLGNSYAKIGNLSNATVIPSGGTTQVVPAGSGSGTTPELIVNSSQPAASVAGPSGFDFTSLFATYNTINSELGSCVATVSLLDQNGSGPWNGTDSTATLRLVAGTTNVLSVTPAQLAVLQNINPANGSATPSSSTSLIINVVGSGSYTMNLPNPFWQGNEPSRHVLWNINTSGTVTFAPGTSTLWGTFYGPSASLVDLSAANIEGNVVTRTLQEGSSGQNGGEIHYAPFSNLVTCTAAPTPAIALTKSVAQTSFNAVGQTLNYSYLVRNTGGTALSGIVVNDAKAGVSAITCPVTTLAAGATTTCTATYTTTQADLDAGSVVNSATASGTPPTGPPVTSSPSTTTVPAVTAVSISLVKSATQNTFTAPGQTINYSYLVRNTGNVTLSGVVVQDSLAGVSAASCPVTTLAPGATTTCTATYTTTQANLDAGSIVNTATASGNPAVGAPATSAPSSVTIPAGGGAAITVTKSAAQTSFTAAGQTINYSYLVRDTGNRTLTNVHVSDALSGVSTIVCPATTLAPGATTTCTATYVTTQADVDAGSVANSATASGTPAVGAPVTSTPSTTTIPFAGAVSIGLTKSVAQASFSAAGQTLNYSYLVTNTGSVTLASVGVTDTRSGVSPVVCPVTTLAPGAATTCTATYTTTQADLNAGSVVNSATSHGTPPVGSPVTSAPSTATVPAVTAAAIALTKSAAQASFSAAGQTLDYSYLVTNTGNVTLTGVAVSDALAGVSPVVCPVTTLAPGASTTCTATYVTTQADVDTGAVENSATANGIPAVGAPVASPPSTVTVPAVAFVLITLTKSVAQASFSAVGQTLDYSYLVTNTGNITLTDVGVTDARAGVSPVVCPVTTLAPTASTTCTATYTTTQADLNAGSVVNSATSHGTPPVGAPVISAPSTTTVPAATTASVALVKSVAQASFTAAGQTLNYSYLVTNTGTVTLTNVAVSDALAGVSPVVCPVTTLAPGASTTCTATYVTTQADLNAGVVNNSATAAGTPPVGSPVVSAPSTTSVPGLFTPAITLTKSVAQASFSAPGQTLDYSYLVTNTGNTTLTNVGVADQLAGVSPVVCPVTVLAPAASTTCTATYTTTQADLDAGVVENTATSHGTPPVLPPVTSAPSSTSVPAVATPSITLAKSVAQASFSAPGQTLNYSYLVTNTGNTSLSNVAVADVLPGVTPAVCPVTTLAPGASTTCTATYVTTQADLDSGAVENSATAAGVPAVGTPVTSAPSSTTVPAATTSTITLTKSVAQASFSAPGETLNYSYLVTNTGTTTLSNVAVSDVLAGVSPVVCPVTTLAPGASTTCTATYVTTQADLNAGAVQNTATAAGDPPAGEPVSSAPSSTSVPAVTTTSITLTKSVAQASFNAAGQTLNYSYLVTNTGTTTLSNVAVSDVLAGVSPVVCPVTTLAPGASTTCTATYVTTQADLDSGVVNNSATAAGVPAVGSPVTSAPSATSVPAVSSTAIALTKSVAQASFTAPGETLNYSYLVTNTGTTTLTNVVVTDSLVGVSPAVCPVTTLAPGASTTCTATYTTTQADVDAGAVNNSAISSGDPTSGPPVWSAPSTTTVPAVSTTAITLAKSVAQTSFAGAGVTLNYSYLVTNTGSTTLFDVAVADALTGVSPVVCPVTTLAPGASTTCTATYTTTAADVTAGSVANNAVAAGNPAVGAAVNSAPSATTVPAAELPSIALVKSVAQTSFAAAGTTLNYTYLVTNTGNAPLTGVAVTDVLAGVSPVVCPVTTLAPGASTTCSASYVTTAADVLAGTVDNSATATGTPPLGAPVVSGVSTTTVPLLLAPAISISKSVNPQTFTAAGDLLTYSYIVTNSGNAALTAVAVTDLLAGVSPVMCPVTTLAVAEATTCTATYTTTTADVLAGQVVNTAFATGTPPVGLSVTSGPSSATATIVPAPAVTLLKSVAQASFTAPGETLNYTYLVTNTGNVALTAVGVADMLVGVSPVACPVTTLAPGAATSCTATYTTTQADVDAGAVDNSATASGTPATGGPVESLPSATTVPAVASSSITLTKSVAEASFAAPGETLDYSYLVTNTGTTTLNNVFVADVLVGVSPVVCPVTTLAPGAATTCTATYTTTQADVDAGSVANSATAHGTPVTGGPVSSPPSATTVPAVATSSISLTKSVAQASFAAPGETLNYSYLVTNTGTTTLSNVAVSDVLAGVSPVVCPVTTLAPGTSTTCASTYLTTQADVDTGAVENSATASGTPAIGTPVTSEPSSTTVPATSTSSISLTKTAAQATFSAPGQILHYLYFVTNTGTTTLTNVQVTDELAGVSPVTCPITTMAPGGSATCNATYTTTQADVDAGGVSNTALANGDPPVGAPVVSNPSSTTVPAVASSSIALVKSVAQASFDAPGQTLNYSYLVTNTGTTTLNGVAVADVLAGVSPVVCPVTTLAPGASTTCTATYVTTQADVDTGAVENSATSSGVPPIGSPVISTPSATTVPAGDVPSIALVKSAAQTSFTGPGETLNYSYLVTNTGNTTLTSVSVTDILWGVTPPVCPVSTLAPGASTTCTATYVTTQADVDTGAVENSATASGDPITGPPVTSAPSATIVPAGGVPSIALVKSAAQTSFNAAGETLDYSYLVTNTGNLTLENIVVLDALAGVSPVVCPVTSLAPGASTTCSASYVTTQADVDTGAVENSATATGDPLAGPPVTSAPSSTTVPAGDAPAITLLKSVAQPSFAAAGETLNYSYLVTNTGNTTLNDVVVSDTLAGVSPVVCPVTTLAPGASTTCAATYVTTQADVDSGAVENSAMASGTPVIGSPVTSAPSSTTIPAEGAASIALVKSVAQTSFAAPGTTLNYSYLVTNTGNATLTGIVISDALPGLTSPVCPTTTLLPNASTTCTASYVTTQADVDTGGVDNTATAHGTPSIGAPVSSAPSSTSVPAVDGPSIALVKSVAQASFNDPGETLNYSYLVTNTGNTTLTNVQVNDALTGVTPVTCPVTTLAPGAATTCTASYVTTQADVDTGAVENSATAAGTPGVGEPVTSLPSTTTTPAIDQSAITLVKSVAQASFDAPGETLNYSYLVTNTGNDTLTNVQVNDALAGVTPVVCPVTTLAPGASTTCAASYVTTQADVDTGAVENSATAVGTPPSGAPVTSPPSATTVPANDLPSIALVKSVRQVEYSAAGQVLNYSYLVTNTGNTTLTNVVVNDGLAGVSAVVCPVTTLLPGASTTCTATYTTTQADLDAGSVSNSATSAGTPAVGSPVTSAPSSTTVAAADEPSIALTKSVAQASFTAAGQTLNYSYLITNTGNVTLTNVVIHEAVAGVSPVVCPVTVLAPGASTTCAATYVTTQADADSGAVENSATSAGTPVNGAPVISTPSTTTVPYVGGPAISLVKSVRQTSFSAAGQTLNYSYAVTNIGNATLTGVTVTDTRAGVSAVVCPVTTLAPGASTTCTATYVTTQSDVTAGMVQNSATANGTAPGGGPVVSDPSSTSVPLTITPVPPRFVFVPYPFFIPGFGDGDKGHGDNGHGGIGAGGIGVGAVGVGVGGGGVAVPPAGTSPIGGRSVPVTA